MDTTVNRFERYREEHTLIQYLNPRLSLSENGSKCRLQNDSLIQQLVAVKAALKKSVRSRWKLAWCLVFDHLFGRVTVADIPFLIYSEVRPLGSYWMFVSPLLRWIHLKFTAVGGRRVAAEPFWNQYKCNESLKQNCQRSCMSGIHSSFFW